MARISVLPDVLVDQIAAGEVVERPASVVKELVENSLDAGSTRVEVEIEGGGIARLSVSDDGCGMDPDDARLALERHATSKVRTAEDLGRIGSLGFRGEALPSIASVSRLVLTTSPDGSGLGTEVVADRGEAPVAKPVRQTKGTRVVVEDLFGNVPARRKYLKSADAEQRAVVKALTSLALSRPDVAFTLRSGERELLSLPAAPSILDRFGEVMGRGSLPRVIAVDFAHAGMRLLGVVSPPETTFASRTFQWLFVNGRAARDGSVAHAARLAAEEALLGERHPAWALFVSCPPERVDPNVHPQKSEVRFLEPGAVHALVHRGLRAALTEGKSATELSASSLSGRRAGGLPGVEGTGMFPDAPPASAVRAAGWTDAPPAAAALAETLGLWDAAAKPGAAGDAPPISASGPRSSWEGSPAAAAVESPAGTLRLLGQYRESYLVAEGAEGLVFVDQHVAHERVRFERIRDRLEGQGLASQTLLVPVSFEAAPEEAEALRRADEVLVAAGFAVSELSGRLFVVSAAPADVPPEKVVAVLRDLLGRLLEASGTGAGRAGDTAARMKDALAASLACRGAITVNRRLAPEEAARLLADLSACRDPWTCPHGRPILLTLAHAEVLKRFGRSSG
ncbi:MAG: DNA mismatch repair endonuclease MutL [Thermoanaerobaculia bacterium]|nr:DNA mismatch repair endonuclease MutL [Thermoanaerobaculia bacterium]